MMLRPCLLAGLLLALPAEPARALGVPLPQLPAPVGGLVEPLAHETEAQLEARTRRVRELLRERRDVLALDPAGDLAVRGEVLALAPSPAALEAARAAGFVAGGDTALDGLGLRVVTLRAPAGWSLRRAMRALRRLDPAGSYAYNHLYLGAGTPPPRSGAPAAGTGGARRAVGLVDGGIDPAHPALAAAAPRTFGCGGRRVPDPHGTAVAALLTTPRTRVHAADVYCGEPTGGAVLRLAEALDWLARERVPVVNLSLVGPPNPLLERLVAATQARGMVLVAAVGNDGPAAPPLYPAAYPGVIGVAAVDARGRPLPESGRGAQVDFAAAGLFELAGADGRVQRFRGTSFAAPRVARRAALLADGPRPGLAASVQAALAAEARDAGPGGRDAHFGEGVLDEGPVNDR